LPCPHLPWPGPLSSIPSFRSTPPCLPRSNVAKQTTKRPERTNGFVSTMVRSAATCWRHYWSRSHYHQTRYPLCIGQVRSSNLDLAQEGWPPPLSGHKYCNLRPVRTWKAPCQRQLRSNSPCLSQGIQQTPRGREMRWACLASTYNSNKQEARTTLFHNQALNC
jgi:hypothetical protein